MAVAQRKWQSRKYKTDPEWRENKKRQNREWKRKTGYNAVYHRQTNPKYREYNRIKSNRFYWTRKSMALANRGIQVSYWMIGKSLGVTPQRAEQIYQEALAMYERVWGARHSSVAICYRHLARVETARGDHDQAELLISKAIDLVQENLPERHPAIHALDLVILARLAER